MSTNSTTETKTTTTTTKRRTRSQTKAEATKVAGKVSAYSELDPEIERLRQQQAEKVKTEKTIEKLSSSLAKARNDASKSLTEVEDQIRKSLDDLNSIHEAYQVKAAQLEELYDKETLAQGLRDLSNEYEEKRLDTEGRLRALRKDYDEKAEELKQEHERKKAEFNYSFERSKEQERNSVEDEIAAKKRDAQRHLDEEYYKMQRAREQLENEQAEWEEARARLEGLDEEIAQKVNQKVATQTNAIKREYDHKSEAFQTQMKAEAQIKDAEIARLQADISAARTDLTNAQNVISNLQNKLTNMTEEALRASSGRQTLEEMREWQANNKDKR